MTIGRPGWGDNERLPPTIAWRRSICKLLWLQVEDTRVLSHSTICWFVAPEYPDAHSTIESSDSRSAPCSQLYTFSPLRFKSEFKVVWSRRFYALTAIMIYCGPDRMITLQNSFAPTFPQQFYSDLVFRSPVNNSQESAAPTGKKKGSPAAAISKITMNR